MKLGIFAIFDVKAAAYLRPFYSQTAGTATREWAMAIADPKSSFALYPADYHLAYLGEFDDNHGVFNTAKPEIVTTASALVQIGDLSNNVHPLDAAQAS